MSNELTEFREKLGVKPQPNSKDKHGFTHLHWAVMDTNVAAVAELLANGAAAQATAWNIFGAFDKPTRTFRERMQRFEISFDDANFWTVRELTPLHIAASLNSVDIMKVLFEHGARFDTAAYPDLNPVHLALCAGNESALHALLRNGFDVNAKNRESRTMLHWLAMSDADARVFIFLGGQYSTFSIKLEDPVDAARLLLTRDASVSARDGNGYTPLHLAAATNMHRVAKVLVDFGADVGAASFTGATPLHLSAWFNSRETANLLLQHGAQVNCADAAGNTPLHIAAADDALETTGVHLPHGSCCARDGKNLVLALLVEHGASISAQNREGHSPLSIAEKKRASTDTFDFLCQSSET